MTSPLPSSGRRHRDPADQIQAGDTPDLAQAIHNYFAYLRDMAVQEVLSTTSHVSRPVSFSS